MATVTLQQKGKTVTGRVDAEGYIYVLRGVRKGARVDGQVRDPQTEGTMRMTMSLSGRNLRIRVISPDEEAQTVSMNFTRVQATRRPAQEASAATASRDPNIVGRWRYTNSTSSSYSGFGMVTEIHIHVFADGTYVYGNGRTMASSAGVSVDSGQGGTTKGRWKTENGVVYVKEEDSSQWTPFAKYYIERGSMLLTYPNGKKELWNKY